MCICKVGALCVCVTWGAVCMCKVGGAVCICKVGALCVCVR